jgi:hypothetical protein
MGVSYRETTQNRFNRGTAFDAFGVKLLKQRGTASFHAVLVPL